MSAWIFWLAASSLGVLLLAAWASVAFFLLRRSPIGAYRLAVAALIALLALPFSVAWSAQRGLPFLTAAMHRAAALDVAAGATRTEADRSPSAGASTRIEPGALAALLALLLPEATPAPTPMGSATDAAPDLVAAPSVPATGTDGARPFWPPALVSLVSPSAVTARLLFVLWAAGTLFGLVRFVRRLALTRELVRDARGVRSPAVLATWNELVSGSRLDGAARLCTSERLTSPACFGWRRPVVILPATDVRPELLRWALRHELVHLERRDTWVILAQEVFRSVFWFHPAAWWLRNKLDVLRELSCDETVARRSGDKKRYAAALIEYATRSQGAGRPAGTVALVPWTGSQPSFTRRIEMLIAPEAGGTKLRSVILSTSAPAFALALLTPLALAAGRARPEPVPTQDGADVAAPARDAMTQRDSSAVAARPVARFEREPRGAVAGRPARNPLAQRERSAATDEGRLGLELAPLDEALAAHLGLSSDARIVRGVDALGSADAAGVRRHDIVVRIDGEAPGASDSLLRARRRLARDGSLRLELVRAGRPLTLELRAHAPQTGDSQDRFRALGYVADEADASDRSQRADRPARRRSESLAGGGSRVRAAENSDPDLERRTGPSGDVDLDSARDLIESARRYYERVNESDFRTDLADAAEALRRSGLESGEGRQALTQLEGLLDDGSLMETIDRSKRYLDSVDPRDFLVTLARTPDARDVDDARPTYLDRWRELDAATARDELARDRAQGPARSFERATSPQRTKDAAAWLERETELLQRLRNAEERLRAQERELDQWRRDLEDLRSRFPADSPRRGAR